MGDIIQKTLHEFVYNDSIKLPVSRMPVLKTFSLFVVTALAEILGCYLPYLWLKKGGSAWLLLPAAISLAVFAWLLSLHPTAGLRRGVYIRGARLVVAGGRHQAQHLGRRRGGGGLDRHGDHHVCPALASLNSCSFRSKVNSGWKLSSGGVVLTAVAVCRVRQHV
jgi:hypothetical protein